MKANAAVIFDVDGPLLDLTAAETAAFFVPFHEAYGLTQLSEDWDSYALRNDFEIYREVLRDAGLASNDAVVAALRGRYLRALDQIYAGDGAVAPIEGALSLLQTLTTVAGLALGTATANFEAAAEKRLRRAGMWEFVGAWHSGAEGGGAKRDILNRVMLRLRVPPDRIVFIGDNLNDLDAAEANGTHFIGFHTEPERQERLRKAGANWVCGDHIEVLRLIRAMLGLNA